MTDDPILLQALLGANAPSGPQPVAQTGSPLLASYMQSQQPDMRGSWDMNALRNNWSGAALNLGAGILSGRTPAEGLGQGFAGIAKQGRQDQLQQRDFEQQLALNEQKKSLYEAYRKTSSVNAIERLPTGFVLKDGTAVNVPLLDRSTGKLFFSDPKTPGGFRTFSEADIAEQITQGMRTKNAAGVSDLSKLEDEIVEDERGLRQLSRYGASVEGMRQGVGAEADRLTTAFKTLLTGGKLNQEQLSQAMARGQLQGLIGAFRKEVVGGGVMTEQDALRVINRLGGDIGALTNKEVVQRAISELMSEKLETYRVNVKRYNTLVEGTPGTSFTPWDMRDFSNPNAPTSVPAAPTASPTTGPSVEDLLKKYGVE